MTTIAAAEPRPRNPFAIRDFRLLMLIGGVSVDRLSPRRVMLAAKLLSRTVRRMGLEPVYEAAPAGVARDAGAQTDIAPASA
ncbi:MAG TPA: hypothetical protein VFP56_01455 [Candidatus Limnocylindrales bacterium]|nr:hypothetical protein [Candidatus Limnocylindrales bacterium]